MLSRRGELMKKCCLVGCGTGLALFAMFGLLQGSTLGGTAGLWTATHFLGAGTFDVMGDDLLLRTVLAASMLTGVIVSGIMFIAAGVASGALVGFTLSLFVSEAEA